MYRRYFLGVVSEINKKESNFLFIIRGETNEGIHIIYILKKTYSNQQTFI